jgi:hypothetical protein
MYMFENEWFWVAVIVAVPLVLFGSAEATMAWRRRRFDALARRSKSEPPRRSRRIS